MTSPSELAEIENILTGKVKRRARAPKPREVKPVDAPEMVVQSTPSPTAKRKAWPFATMKKGEWFAVKKADDHQRARCSASAYFKRKGRRFTCIVEKETGHLIVTRVL